MENERNKWHQGMWNFISSPEDNFLERDLGFNAQFFAFAVFIGPLVPEPNAWGSERSQEEGWGGAPQEREVIILWKSWPSGGWLCTWLWRSRFSFSQKSPSISLTAPSSLRGLVLEFATAAVGREDEIVNMSVKTCNLYHSFRNF